MDHLEAVAECVTAPISWGFSSRVEFCPLRGVIEPLDTSFTLCSEEKTLVTPS
jgi:hypothetical protein